MAKDVVREWVSLAEALARETAVWRDPEFAQSRVRVRMDSGDWPYRYFDRDGVQREGGLPDGFWTSAMTLINWAACSAKCTGIGFAMAGTNFPLAWVGPVGEAYRVEVFVPASATPGKPAAKMGRPSARDLVRAEAERQLREELSRIPDSLQRWGDTLSDWLTKQPGAPFAEGRTCEAYVRHLYKLAKARKAKKSGKYFPDFITVALTPPAYR